MKVLMESFHDSTERLHDLIDPDDEELYPISLEVERLTGWLEDAVGIARIGMDERAIAFVDSLHGMIKGMCVALNHRAEQMVDGRDYAREREILYVLQELHGPISAIGLELQA